MQSPRWRSPASTRSSRRATATGAARAAIEAGVLELDGERVRFTHPLLADATYKAIPLDERHALHARLATIVHDEESRARHLALAASGPDASVALALDAAAGRAAGRGAQAIAAELAELRHAGAPRSRRAPISDAGASRQPSFISGSVISAPGERCSSSSFPRRPARSAHTSCCG